MGHGDHFAEVNKLTNNTDEASKTNFVFHDSFVVHYGNYKDDLAGWMAGCPAATQ